VERRPEKDYGPGRRYARLGEYLLAALGQAAGICPHVEGSLKGARPAGHELDTRGAHEFLTEKAMLLEQAGFA